MNMANEIIGREEEIKLLEECYQSGKAELVAVYGRRRVGKTYLVKTCFRIGLTSLSRGNTRGNFGTNCICGTGNSWSAPETSTLCRAIGMRLLSS